MDNDTLTSLRTGRYPLPMGSFLEPSLRAAGSVSMSLLAADRLAADCLPKEREAPTDRRNRFA